MSLRSFIGTLVAIVTLACQSIQAQESSKAVSSEEKLFDVLAALLKDRPLTPNKAGHLLGFRLKLDPKRGNEYTQVYVGGQRQADLIERAELRVATSASDNFGQFLILDLNSRRCLKVATIEERYGQGALSVPTPHQPVDSPIYLDYQIEWGRLSFGFAPGVGGCLRSVVMDIQATP